MEIVGRSILSSRSLAPIGFLFISILAKWALFLAEGSRDGSKGAMDGSRRMETEPLKISWRIRRMRGREREEIVSRW